MKKMYSFVLLMILVGSTLYSQNSSMQSIVQNYFNQTISKSSLAKNDVSEWKITDVVPSLNPDVQHVYVQQYYQGIPIQYGTYKLTVKGNERVTWEINQFVDNVSAKVVANKSASISPEAAIIKVASAHGLKTPKLINSKKTKNGELSYEDNSVALEPMTAEQVYVKDGDALKLTWRVSLYEKTGQHWWNVNVDTSTGEILHTEDWVITCNWGDTDHKNHSHHSHKEEIPVMFPKEEAAYTKKASAALAPDSYNVYPIPIESPIHGSRSIVTDPANTTASPYGWHDTNGSAGAEYTITRGNNVWAQEDRNGNNGTGFSPNGGSSLDFDFPVNFNQAPSQYDDAAITNLFFWNNIMHDVWYQYGFDEASGNFQENNYGKGGTGGDSVNADAQDGSGTNNANFSTPREGGNPRMQMFLWNRTNPNRDGDFDNGIIAHEYGHGISIRLVGGPNTNALGGSEQMGEGWSDWFGLMLTIESGDQGTDRRGIGTYALGESPNGDGIRPTPYSTDRSINDTDYADIDGLRVPHGVGYAFATILWDMAWALIDEEGFDQDFYNGTGGNNIAMALVIEGLKNTANNPGFVSGRDGILQADQDLYNGQYECIIWKVFAARGVGENADENDNGGSNSNSDQTVSFVNPCDGGGPDPDPDPSEECTGSVASFPYSESFEGSIGDWVQSENDDIDWTRTSGGTPSNNTGPSSAADGSDYIYVEASGNGTGFPDKKAILNSPCLNFSSLTEPILGFQYHMFGSQINSLTVEARTDNTGDWESVFSRSGAQGNNWNTASVDLSTYAGESSVQLRFEVITGTGSDGWQSDIAIDDLSIGEDDGDDDPNPPTDDCITVDFSSVTVSSFSNQDNDGDFEVQDSGASLFIENNSWKSIPFTYNVTTETVIEFDFSSTDEGEIHAIGFENDNDQTNSRTNFFKLHGTQNYGSTNNYDNYSGSGTTTYVIPVGDFYTGAMNRLVFINDDDNGSGNNSKYTNIRVYEGSCGDSSSVMADRLSFGPNTPIIGNENETISSMINLFPNPTKNEFSIRIVSSNEKVSNNAIATIYSLLGKQQAIIKLNSGDTTLSAQKLSLTTGIYLISIDVDGDKFIQKLIIQ